MRDSSSSTLVAGGNILLTTEGEREKDKQAHAALSSLNWVLLVPQREKLLLRRSACCATMEEVRDEGIRLGGHHAAMAAGARHNEHTSGTKRGARFQEVSERGSGASTPLPTRLRVQIDRYLVDAWLRLRAFMFVSSLCCCSRWNAGLMRSWTHPKRFELR